MSWGNLQFGQTTGGVAPEAISLVNDTTTLVAGAVIIALLLGLAVFMGAANYSQTGSVWDFGSQRRKRRRKSRRK